MIFCLSKYYSGGLSQGGCASGCDFFGRKTMNTEFGWGILKDGT